MLEIALREHRYLRHKGQCTLRADHQVGYDVEYIVIRDQRQQVESHHIFNRIFLSYASRQGLVSPYLVTQSLQRANKIVVDYWESIKHRMISTVALMWRDGLVKDEEIHAEMGEILGGKKPGRENDEEIIYFNAVGAGIMDIAVTARCYRAALEKGDGIVIPFWED